MSIPEAVRALQPTWNVHAFGRLVQRRRDSGQPELEPLSVFLDEGVVPRSSRDDNHNRLGEDLSKYLVVQPGDLVFNKLRTWQGGFGWSRHRGIVSPAYFVCHPGPEVEVRFLDYILHSQPYLAELTRVSKFMPPSQFDIGWEDLRTVRVILPPPDQQRAIADYLDAETARIDALIEKKRLLMALIEERFDACVFDSVTKGLRPNRTMKPSGLPWTSEIPSDWGTPTVSANFELQLGKMLNADAVVGPEQYPYLRNVNVQWDRIDLGDVAEMFFSPNEKRRCSLQVGDLLVCEGGEVGRAAVWNGELTPCFYQKAIHRLRPRGNDRSRFLMYALRAAAMRSVFAIEGNTSTIVHLTGEQLSVHRFPWPSPDEQDEIVRHLDAVATASARARSGLERQLALLAECRQAVITEAVTEKHSVAA